MTTAPVVVLAGGLGTRLREVTGDLLPKVLVPVGGRPFIDYKLHGLAHLGAREVLLLTGYQADQVHGHVGSGERYGLQVRCVADGPEPLGTAGSVARVLEHLPGTFWLTYGDTFVEAPLAEVEASLDASTDGAMTVLENRDRWEPSNVTVEDGRIVCYGKGDPPGTHRWIDYGLLLFRHSAFDTVSTTRPSDLRDVVSALVDRRRLGVWSVAERFWDVGTAEALRATEAHFAAAHVWERIT